MHNSDNNKTAVSVPQQPLCKRILHYVIRFGIPLLMSGVLIAWLFHKVNIHQVETIIRQGCDFRWIVLMMVLTTMSHIIRGIRWGIQLRGAGVPRMTVTAESVAIFGAYALNLIFQSLGEAWRCIYVSRRERVPLTTVIGTDIGDRASDAVMIVLISSLAAVVARPALESFLSHYAVGRDLTRFFSDPMVWCVIVGLIAAISIILHFCGRSSVVSKIKTGVSKIWQGFRILFTMRGKGVYVVLTFGIWTCYFLETYVCFYAFPFTRELIHQPGMAYGLIPGLVVFVFGSFSMAIPSNGGLGPWNLAVMFALSLYGISDTDGTAFSLVMWGFQALMLVILGIFSAIYVSTTGRRAAGSAVSKTVTP